MQINGKRREIRLLKMYDHFHGWNSISRERVGPSTIASIFHRDFPILAHRPTSSHYFEAIVYGFETCITFLLTVRCHPLTVFR